MSTGKEKAEDDHQNIVGSQGPLDGMKVYSGVRPDFLKPLDKPTWIPADGASMMREDDFVLGYSSGGLHMALPWWIMKNHHVANLELPGLNVVIILCENCSSAAAFDATLEGGRHTFQVAGTYRGTFFTEDRESGTFWAPFMGEAIHGPLAGSTMTPLPLYQCSWAEWKELHPDAVVQSGENESRDGHGAGTEPGSLLKVERRMAKSVARDRRLKRNALVLGAQVGDEAKAYPLSAIEQVGGVVNDTLGGQAIVVAGRRSSVFALAYSREVDSRSLTFESTEAGMRDLETGSFWNVEGYAIDGALQGRRLAFVQSLVGEWYEFAASHPGVDVFDVGAAKPD